MDSVAVILIVVLAAIALVFLTRLPRRRRSTDLFRPEDLLPTIQSATAPTGAHPHLDRLATQQITSQLRAGNRLAAITLYRQRTGADLRRARQAIENWPMMLPAQGSPSGRPAPMARSDLDDKVRSLVASRRRFVAVKLVRQHTGMPLRDAKYYVDRLTPH